MTAASSAIYFFATKVLLQPMPLLLLLSGLALANLWRRRVEGRRRLALAAVPMAALAAASTPAVVYPVVGSLEWPYPPVAGRPADAQAIVVLGGGIKGPDSTRLRPELTEDTTYRCLHAAELYHRAGPCPVVVTGGVLDPGSTIPPVAPAMRELLTRLGVRDADVIVESRARTTYENAVEAREILRGRGLRRVLLVTEAVHMRRSLLCFRKQGVDAVAAPCLHRATGFEWGVEAFIPSPGAMKDLMAALHEWLGLAWYRARGRI